MIATEYDLTSHVTPGQPVDLEYRLQSYFNTCSPHNPGCVSGTTCTDCNYNYTGHTEPHYKIASQLISYLGSPNTTTTHDLFAVPEFTIVPNPSAGFFELNISGVYQNYHLEVFDLIGKSLISINAMKGSQMLNLSTLPKGIYFLNIRAEGMSSVKKLIIN